jgi:hypothetical protein
MRDVFLMVDAASPSATLELDLATILSQVQQPLSQALPSGATLTCLTTDDWQQLGQRPAETILLPLTFHLPTALPFGQELLWQQCQDLDYWRHLVGQLGAVARINSADPRYWLPIVWTAKGPLYGEVIGQNPGHPSHRYIQPIHFPDQWRQPLYGFAYQLLKAMAAVPSVYLLEFGWHDQPFGQPLGQQLGFDRLWPFPHQAALASLGVQTPDLFTCHWRCLAGLPITDLHITGDVEYRLVDV